METANDIKKLDINSLRDTNENLYAELQKIREGKCTDCIQHLITDSHKKALEKTNSYIKALEEIKIIADDTFQVCDDDCGNARKIKLIIDKINEVLQ